MSRLKISDISFCETEFLNDSQVQGGLAINSSAGSLIITTSSTSVTNGYEMTSLSETTDVLPSSADSLDEIASASPILTTSSGNVQVSAVVGTFNNGGGVYSAVSATRV